MTADPIRPPQRTTKIALLDAYSGSNLGDAAIIDATIANLRARLPNVVLSAVTLNVEEVSARHGLEGAPLCRTNVAFYSMSTRASEPKSSSGSAAPRAAPGGVGSALKRQIKGVAPGVWATLKAALNLATLLPRELRHFWAAKKFLRSHGLLIVSGGGQLDEEWGGPWGHPYALFKWTLAARLAGAPAAIASVGACQLNHRWSRYFIGAALGRSSYRSYRDKHSRGIASGLVAAAEADRVVPDLALAMPPAMVPKPAGHRVKSGGRRVVAVSPIAYGKRGAWATENETVYSRYLSEMARVIARLVERDYFLVFVWSSMPDDKLALAEILARLDPASKEALRSQSITAEIGDWRDLVAALQDADVVVASRLHSLILALLVRKPSVAISFDPKVDWLMEDLEQTDLLLNIRDFAADDVVALVDRLIHDVGARTAAVDAYMSRATHRLARQFDELADLAR